MVEITLLTFAIVACMIFIGFLGELLFKKFEIPGIFIIMVTGYLIGPQFHLVDPNTIKILQPFLGQFTLLMVLFEAGMLLNIFIVIKQSFRPMLFGILLTILSGVATAIITNLFFKFDFTIGLLLGVVLAGSAAAITVPIISKMKLPNNLKTFMILEPSFSEVISTVLVIVLTGAILSGAAIDTRNTGKNLMAMFLIGGAIGGIIGVVWLVLLNKVEKITEYVYMATLAVLLLIYVFVEYFGSSGLIAALVFGLIMGNRDDISNMLQLNVEKTEGVEKLGSFHAELSFLVRTVFFTYLGIIFTIPSINIIIISAAIVIGLYFARLIASFICTIGSEFSNYNMFIASFVDKGLSVAVLSIYPLTFISQLTNPALANIKTQLALFPNIAFMVIVGTALISTIGIIFTKPVGVSANQDEMAPIIFKKVEKEEENNSTNEDDEMKEKMREKIREKLKK